MGWLFKTIRGKLLFSFFAFFFIVSLIILGNIWFSSRESAINKIRAELDKININFQSEKNLEKDFYLHETINPQFFADNGRSRVLDERKQKLENITSSLKTLKGSNILSSQLKTLEGLEKYFEQHEATFRDVVDLIIKKGFKDYGAIGDMRKSIHDLEAVITGENLTSMLMLRRHEKDFLLRKQSSYLTKHRKEAVRLRKQIKDVKKVFLVDQYSNTFQKMAGLEREIGYDDTQGQKKVLKDITSKIEGLIESLNKEAISYISSIQTQLGIIRIVLVVIALVLFIFLVFYTTRIISKPITRLSDSIEEVVNNNFDESVKIAEIESNDEIGTLAKDFKKMLERVKSSLGEIQEKSDELELNNNILTEGVTYAKRIQKAILPDYELEESRYFKKYYLIYRPKYEVSGDFYWYTEVQDKAYIAVVDCTGKGVAGAFMSMIGNSLLNRIINERGIHDPAFILETLNTEVRLALRQDRKANEDRMDVCLCQIENIPTEKGMKRRVTFAGANRSLFYGEREVHEVKGTARSIGGKMTANRDLNFENHQIELISEDYLYLTTKGFIQQYNPDKERFGKERLTKFFKNNLHQKMEKQKELLEELLDRYADGTVQTDDMTVLVLKV